MKQSVKQKLLKMAINKVIKDVGLHFLIFPIIINIACSILLSVGMRAFPTSDRNAIMASDFLTSDFAWPIYVLFFVLMCLVVPWAEEIVFRKWLWGLTVWSIGDKHALWVTSAVFAFLHGGWYGFALLPMAFYLGWIRRSYGSYRYSTAVHSVFNLCGLVLIWGGV